MGVGKLDIEFFLHAAHLCHFQGIEMKVKKNLSRCSQTICDPAVVAYMQIIAGRVI